MPEIAPVDQNVDQVEEVAKRPRGRPRSIKPPPEPKLPKEKKIKPKKPPGIIGRPKGSGDSHKRALPPPSVAQLLAFLVDYENFLVRLNPKKKTSGDVKSGSPSRAVDGVAESAAGSA
jgi:hypothetical protein